MTLSLLPEVEIDNALDAIDLDAVNGAPELEPVDIESCKAFLVWAQGRQQRAEWSLDASITVGRHIAAYTQVSGALLIIEVDGACYAVAYGQGFRWLRDEYRDQRFGLSIAIRCLDPDHLRQLHRRRPGMRGRSDTTLIPAGAPVWWLRPAAAQEIVRRIGGKSFELPMSARRGERPVTLEGSGGIRLRLGLPASAFVEDIRTLARIRTRPLPVEELAFVDNIIEIRSPTIVQQLEGQLDAMIGDSARQDDDIALAIPDAGLDHLDVARGYRLSLTGRAVQPELTLEDVLKFARRYRPGHRIDALRRIVIELHDDESGRERLWGTRALNWLEASISHGSRRYFLMEGRWYEIAATYAEEVTEQVRRIFIRGSVLSLPSWDASWDEATYNVHASQVDSRYLTLDRKLVRDQLHRQPGLEICDLLGPDNELVHVKKAEGSGAISHLFAQGLVSVQSLRGSPQIRERFRQLVDTVGKGRSIPDDFQPKKVVFAILLKSGRQLGPDTLFPFSQATLAQTATGLEQQGIEVEVIGIPLLT